MSVWEDFDGDLCRTRPLSKMLEVLQGVCPRCGGELECVYIPGRSVTRKKVRRTPVRSILPGSLQVDLGSGAQESRDLWFQSRRYFVHSREKEEELMINERACAVCRRCGADKMDPYYDRDMTDGETKKRVRFWENIVNVVRR